MDEIIKECLENRQDSYILPFLWLHGEPRERIEEEILAIKNSGISEFCAESRPYEEFCRDSWWGDFEFVLETARRLDMRVWLLDDKKFPTGYANGYLEDASHAHLRKRLARELQIEALGPMKGAKLYVGGRLNEGERVIRVIAYRHSGTGEALDYRTAIDLTDLLSDGMVYWDIPNGVWRVSIVVETQYSDPYNTRFPYYIDMLNPQSCRAMIDAVYQPHYKRFKEYFGNTFRGFFSDEPGFLNVIDTYCNKLGILNSPYPWRDDIMSLVASSAGIDKDKAVLYTPALWEDLGEITPLIRTHYMEVVTKLYRENFGNMLGDWCREHGVMYIGHVIEDMGAHTRLGYGSGHFFRALDGQDMAGIDIVLTQAIPGITEGIHRACTADGGATDPGFFRYTLPKLAASHAHIQPLKKDRAMCEIFGAFGWAEGLPYMKGLADMMLASGINYFVPHAFSPKDEDEDCPPHFYNGGRNIQYPLFKELMGYMGRCAHMLSSGVHVADVAVYYNAEGEWACGSCPQLSSVCRTLTQGLADFDIVPFDYLAEARTKNNKLVINNESYGALVVPGCEILPYDRLECFAKLAKEGVSVIFTDKMPTRAENSKDVSRFLSLFECVSQKELVSYLLNRGICKITGSGNGVEKLRIYRKARNGQNIYLVSNEGVYSDAEVQLSLPDKGRFLVYEPWENRLMWGETNNGQVPLRLEKGNMLFLVFGGEIPNGTSQIEWEKERVKAEILFDISLRQEGETESCIFAKGSPCVDISSPEAVPHFSGEVIYKATFTPPNGFDVIDLGQVGEVAQVWLNGEYLGARINAPYKFSMKKALKEGENTLEISVKSNPAHRRRDSFSSYIQIPPTGIIGDVCFCKYAK